MAAWFLEARFPGMPSAVADYSADHAGATSDAVLLSLAEAEGQVRVRSAGLLRNWPAPDVQSLCDVLRAGGAGVESLPAGPDEVLLRYTATMPLERAGLSLLLRDAHGEFPMPWMHVSDGCAMLRAQAASQAAALEAGARLADAWQARGVPCIVEARNLGTRRTRDWHAVPEALRQAHGPLALSRGPPLRMAPLSAA